MLVNVNKIDLNYSSHFSSGCLNLLQGGVVASRNIQAGEELFVQYGSGEEIKTVGYFLYSDFVFNEKCSIIHSVAYVDFFLT
jgi:hypothetical protein